MPVREIQAKSILRKYGRIDSWFVSRYGMNLYRGCAHNCLYCDGRSEGYYLEGEFGRDISVKMNAAEVLDRELDPARKRKPLVPGFIIVGGGVGDSYQPAEAHYGITRQVLEVIEKRGFPVHMLTKSDLILRDMDILKRIHQKSGAIVSVSISSVSDAISAALEPGASPPSRRLDTIAAFKKEGIPCGVFLLPVVPSLTDTPVLLDAAVRNAKEAGADFILSGAMTLKIGRQKDYFLETAGEIFPGFDAGYSSIYKVNRWGEPDAEYLRHLGEIMGLITSRYRIPRAVPPRLFRDVVPKNDLVVVILETIHGILKTRGMKSPYGQAARSVSELTEPLSLSAFGLRQINGVGNTTARMIREILRTGTCSRYEQLLMQR